MSEAVSADVSAEMLLWYYEEPRRYRAEGRRRDAPTADSIVVLKLALGRRVDFAQATLNEPRTAATLRDAAALYVRFLFFRPEATPYQVLGLAPGASPEAIKESFRLLMHLVHPDRQDVRVVWPDSYAAHANRAYGVLRNQEARVKFDREAEARAAMARAINRTSAASDASRMPVPVRPRGKARRRGPLQGVALPEWLTAGVGGFAREHPSVTAFSALIGVAVLSIAVMIWDRDDAALTRDLDAASEHSSVMSIARLPKLTWFSPAPSAPAQVASPSSGGTTKRSASTEAKAPSADIAPSASELPAPQARSVAQPSVNVAESVPARVAPNVSTASSANVAADAPQGNASFVRATPVEAGNSTPALATASGEQGSQPPSVAVGTTSQTVASSSTSSQTAVSSTMIASAPANTATPPLAAVTTARLDPASASIVSPAAPASPPATTEIETLFASFVESYERGRVDVLVDLFDVDAEANLRQGKPAIRGEYDELFRLSQWRKMQLTRVNWKRVGNRAIAKGEIVVRIGWRDGREVEQRLALDMELVRRDGRVVIARMSQQPGP